MFRSPLSFRRLLLAGVRPPPASASARQREHAAPFAGQLSEAAEAPSAASSVFFACDESVQAIQRIVLLFVQRLDDLCVQSCIRPAYGKAFAMASIVMSRWVSNSLLRASSLST